MYIKNTNKKTKGRYRIIKIFTKPLSKLINEVDELIKKRENNGHINIIKPIWGK